MREGRLVLVGTPIGNLGDLSPRAAEVLSTADMIAAEDTRRTRALLTHLGVPAGRRLQAVHGDNEAARAREICHVVATGATVAVVTDAGMPSISDPGARLVQACVREGLAVEVVPGPSALLAALVLSGLATDRFVFEGFLPRKGGGRSERMYALGREARTIVLFEAPNRVLATLADLAEACGPARRVAVARELTKLHEEVWRGTLEGALRHFATGAPRGEFVIVVEGRAPAEAGPDDETLAEAARQEIKEGRTTREAADRIADRYGVSRRRAYDIVLTQRSR
ncbi:MAG TPA: 16S rRNA (cytidine(1402)-2'-O)-methyltransferase [Acidimicrobiia bacterium]